MTNLLLGIQSSASTYPCPYCFSPGDTWTPAAPRSLGLIRRYAHDFKAAGAKLPQAKAFYNCVQEPIFPYEDEKLAIEIVPPMELHLMLGIVNHILCNKHFGLATLSPKVAQEWASRLHLEQEGYHGGMFSGPACHTFLKNVDMLQRICENHGFYLGMGHVRVLRAFREVVSKCFGTRLEPSYEHSIKIFEEAYREVQNESNHSHN